MKRKEEEVRVRQKGSKPTGKMSSKGAPQNTQFQRKKVLAHARQYGGQTFPFLFSFSLLSFVLFKQAQRAKSKAEQGLLQFTTQLLQTVQLQVVLQVVVSCCQWLGNIIINRG
jgi:hypothetical protein